MKGKNVVLAILVVVVLCVAGYFTYVLLWGKQPEPSNGEVSSKLEAAYQEQFSATEIDVRGTQFGTEGFDAESLQTVSPQAGALLVENTTDEPLQLRLSAVPQGYQDDGTVIPEIAPGEVGTVNFPTPGLYQVANSNDPTQTVWVTFTLAEETTR